MIFSADIDLLFAPCLDICTLLAIGSEEDDALSNLKCPSRIYFSYNFKHLSNICSVSVANIKPYLV